MAAPLIADLLDLMPDTIITRTTTRDAFGKITARGPDVPVRARIKGQHRLFRGVGGQERISNIRATIAGVFNLTANHEYVLPARFSPQTPPALAVDTVTDENGPHHEVVHFGG
jgi:hypothetical protein